MATLVFWVFFNCFLLFSVFLFDLTDSQTPTTVTVKKVISIIKWIIKTSIAVKIVVRCRDSCCELDDSLRFSRYCVFSSVSVCSPPPVLNVVPWEFSCDFFFIF